MKAPTHVCFTTDEQWAGCPAELCESAELLAENLRLIGAIQGLCKLFLNTKMSEARDQHQRHQAACGEFIFDSYPLDGDDKARERAWEYGPMKHARELLTAAGVEIPS